MTSFVNSIILLLEEEMEDGYLTMHECHDYINLFTMASSYIFHEHPHYHEEVLRLTKPLIKLPSVQFRELEEAYAKNRLK